MNIMNKTLFTLYNQQREKIMDSKDYDIILLKDKDVDWLPMLEQNIEDVINPNGLSAKDLKPSIKFRNADLSLLIYANNREQLNKKLGAFLKIMYHSKDTSYLLEFWDSKGFLYEINYVSMNNPKSYQGSNNVYQFNIQLRANPFLTGIDNYVSKTGDSNNLPIFFKTGTDIEVPFKLTISNKDLNLVGNFWDYKDLSKNMIVNPRIEKYNNNFINWNISDLKTSREQFLNELIGGVDEIADFSSVEELATAIKNYTFIPTKLNYTCRLTKIDSTNFTQHIKIDINNFVITDFTQTITYNVNDNNFYQSMFNIFHATNLNMSNEQNGIYKLLNIANNFYPTDEFATNNFIIKSNVDKYLDLLNNPNEINNKFNTQGFIEVNNSFDIVNRKIKYNDVNETEVNMYIIKSNLIDLYANSRVRTPKQLSVKTIKRTYTNLIDGQIYTNLYNIRFINKNYFSCSIDSYTSINVNIHVFALEGMLNFLNENARSSQIIQSDSEYLYKIYRETEGKIRYNLNDDEEISNYVNITNNSLDIFKPTLSKTDFKYIVFQRIRNTETSNLGYIRVFLINKDNYNKIELTWETCDVFAFSEYKEGETELVYYDVYRPDGIGGQVGNPLFPKGTLSNIFLDYDIKNLWYRKDSEENYFCYIIDHTNKNFNKIDFSSTEFGDFLSLQTYQYFDKEYIDQFNGFDGGDTNLNYPLISNLININLIEEQFYNDIPHSNADISINTKSDYILPKLYKYLYTSVTDYTENILNSEINTFLSIYYKNLSINSLNNINLLMIGIDNQDNILTVNSHNLYSKNLNEVIREGYIVFKNSNVKKFAFAVEVYADNINSQNTLMFLPQLEVGESATNWTENGELINRVFIDSRNLINNSALKWTKVNNQFEIAGWSLEGDNALDIKCNTSPLPQLVNGNYIGIGNVSFILPAKITDANTYKKYIKQRLVGDNKIKGNTTHCLSVYTKSSATYGMNLFLQVEEYDEEGQLINTTYKDFDVNNKDYYTRLSINFKTFINTKSIIIKIGMNGNSNYSIGNVYIACPMLERDVISPTVWVRDYYNTSYSQISRNQFVDSTINQHKWAIDNKQITSSIFDYGTVDTNSIIDSKTLKDLGQINAIHLKLLKEQSIVPEQDMNYITSNPIDIISGTNYILSYYLQYKINNKTSTDWDIFQDISQNVELHVLYLDEGNTILKDYNIGTPTWYLGLEEYSDKKYTRVYLKINDIQNTPPQNAKKVVIKIKQMNGWMTYNRDADFYLFAPQLEEDTVGTEWVNNYITDILPEKPVITYPSFTPVNIVNPAIYKEDGTLFFKYDILLKTGEKLVLDTKKSTLTKINENGGLENIELYKFINYAEQTLDVQLIPTQEMKLYYRDISGTNPNTNKPVQVKVELEWSPQIVTIY